jgi:hypothetical protein|nr:MAG TPA: hypothetical protein [Crassvirales sp.]
MEKITETLRNNLLIRELEIAILRVKMIEKEDLLRENKDDLVRLYALLSSIISTYNKHF